MAAFDLDDPVDPVDPLAVCLAAPVFDLDDPVYPVDPLAAPLAAPVFDLDDPVDPVDAGIALDWEAELDAATPAAAAGVRQPLLALLLELVLFLLCLTSINHRRRAMGDGRRTTDDGR